MGTLKTDSTRDGAVASPPVPTTAILPRIVDPIVPRDPRSQRGDGQEGSMSKVRMKGIGVRKERRKEQEELSLGRCKVPLPSFQPLSRASPPDWVEVPSTRCQTLTTTARNGIDHHTSNMGTFFIIIF